MNTENSNPRRENTLAEKLLRNLPYKIVILLGASIFLAGLGVSLWGFIAAGLYILYGFVGSLWIILFLCPYCRRYGTLSCPSGYGLISAKLRKRQDFGRFAEKFKRHIPVIVPLWFIPPIAGIIIEITRFDWLLLVLLVVFAIDAFVILPMSSKKHGCGTCPQRKDCPWMKDKKKAT
jgi:hypothetical protein